MSPENAPAARRGNPGAALVVQRDAWDAIGEWWNGLFSSDPKDVVRNLDSGLERVSQILDAAASTTIDPQKRSQLEKLGKPIRGLLGITSKIVQVLDTAEKIEAVEKIIDALNDIPEDISSDPEKAADAFGRLFAAAGKLGELLPPGPWSEYFTLLSNARDFFSNMLVKTNVDFRWRDKFKHIEDQKANRPSQGEF